MSNASPMPVKFTRHNAVAQVGRMFDGIQGFIQVIAEEFPGYLDGDHISPEVIAETLGIPTPAFIQVINSNAYQTALDSYAASVTYNLQARIRAMNVLKEVATGGQKLVMSPKGDAVYVDRDTGEIIAADKHLRNLQGRPLETNKGMQATGITIQFGDTINNEQSQHVHITGDHSGTTQSRRESARELDWDSSNAYERREIDAPVERTIESSASTTWGSSRQFDENTGEALGVNPMGFTAHEAGQDDSSDDSGFDDKAYTPPQPGSGPPAGQARAYARSSSGKPFQSHDAEIVDGPASFGAKPANQRRPEDMDPVERIRRVGFGLHQTPPTATERRQAKGTDENPAPFQNILGGDTPITALPKTQVGEEAEEAQERRVRGIKTSRENSLRRYLSQKPLVERDDDD